MNANGSGGRLPDIGGHYYRRLGYISGADLLADIMSLFDEYAPRKYRVAKRYKSTFGSSKSRSCHCLA